MKALKFISLFVPSALALPVVVSAQSFGYQQSGTIGENTRLILQARQVFGLSASFSNLGKVSYPVDEDADEDGDVIDYIFNDGYINVLNEESAYTADFQFLMDNATVGTDGYVDSFTLSRYRSTATDTVYTSNPDSSYGWELAFQYAWGDYRDKLRFGIIGGLAFNSIDFHSNERVEGDLYSQTATVSLEDLRIAYVAGEVYYGSVDGPSINLGEDLYFDAESETRVEQHVWGEGAVPVDSEVYSAIDLDGVMASFRLGPTLDYRVANRIGIQASAGLSATYFHSDIQVQEVLLNTLLASDIEEFDTSSSGEWLGGYYFEGTLYYRINRTMAAYGSVQWMQIQEASEREIEDVQIDVDLESTIVISAGIRMSF